MGPPLVLLLLLPFAFALPAPPPSAEAAAEEEEEAEEAEAEAEAEVRPVTSMARAWMSGQAWRTPGKARRLAQRWRQVDKRGLAQRKVSPAKTCITDPGGWWATAATRASSCHARSEPRTRPSRNKVPVSWAATRRWFSGYSGKFGNSEHNSEMKHSTTWNVTDGRTNMVVVEVVVV